MTALHRNETFGVWGGYTRVERARAMRRFKDDISKALEAHENGTFVITIPRRRNGSR